jgi:hypothetical protein
MEHHAHEHHAHEETRESLDFIYYIVGLLSGLFVGFVIDVGFTWIPVGGILGLLSAAFYLNILVKDRRSN